MTFGKGKEAEAAEVKESTAREGFSEIGIPQGPDFYTERMDINLRAGQNLGYVPPYVPVIQPAEVKKIWIPAHKSETDKDVLISGHWAYLKIKDDAWFIDHEQEEDSSFTIIIPTAQENKL